MRCVLVQSQPDQTSTPLGHIVFAFTIIISLIFLITCKHLCSELWIHLCLISFSCSVIDWPQAIIWLYIVFPADVWFFSLSFFLISTVFICVWLNRGWLGVCLCCLFMVCLGLKWCWSWIVVLWQSGSLAVGEHGPLFHSACPLISSTSCMIHPPLHADRQRDKGGNLMRGEWDVKTSNWGGRMRRHEGLRGQGQGETDWLYLDVFTFKSFTFLSCVLCLLPF